MPNLNEYYHLIQTEKLPFDDETMRGFLRDALERADTEAENEQISPVANLAKKSPILNGIRVASIATGIAILASLALWIVSQRFVAQKAVPTQTLSSEVPTPTAQGTQDANTVSASEPRNLYSSSTRNSNRFSLNSHGELGNSTESRLGSSGEYATIPTEYNSTTSTEIYPADSLLPEDFRSWEMPSLLAWAVAERRYTDARRILDSLLLRRHELPNTKFNLLCLRGHLHKIMASVNASIADYSSALDMHESSELYLLRGIQYRTASQHQEALQDFTNAIRLNPYNAQAVFLRGIAAHKLGRFDEACGDWLAAAEMGNTSADSMLKAKCNPAVVQTIRTAQTKRLQAIKTLALLIERAKESIDKAPSSNSSAQPLTLESLARKILSSACDIPTVLKGEASTHCAFQAIHTIALELQDDSLAAMVNPVIQKKNNYLGSLTSQLNNTPTDAQTDAISPSYFDMEILTSMAKNNPRLQQRTHNYLMKTTPRYSSQMRENNSVAQNQTLPPEILHNVIQAIEKYCRATYHEIAAQAPSSVKTETKVQTLSPPAQEATDRTSQTTSNTTHLKTDEATVLAPIVPNTNSNILQSTNNNLRNSAPQTTPNSTITVAKPKEKQYWQRGRTLYQQQYSLLGQLTQIALSQVGVKTTFSQLFAPCTLSSALTGKSTSDCVLSLLEQQAAQIQDTLIQSFAALALKNKNFTKANNLNIGRPISQTKDIEDSPLNSNSGIAISPLDLKFKDSDPALTKIEPQYKNGAAEHNFNSVTTLTRPQNYTVPSAQDAAAMGYRQYLIAIQNHIWNSVDKLEQPKDSLAQSKPVTPNNTVAKEFQQQNLPMWFQEALRQHRYSYARNIVDSLLIQESSAAELYVLRGDINKAMDSVEASITDYSRALSLQESGEIYLRRGTQYFTANKREEAYQDFDYAVRLEPKDAQAVFMRGAAAYNLKRFEEACDDWYLAAQMGHPLADSLLEVKCANMLPKYARTAQREQAEKMQTLALLLERVKQGIDNMQTSYIRSEQTHRFDSLSYKSLSSRCNISAVLMGSASMHCAIHTLYTFALDLHDIPLALLVKSMGQQPSNYLSLLSSQSSSNNSDVQTNPFEPYFKMVAQQAQPKSSTNQVINEPVIQVIQPSSSSRLLEKIKRTPEQLSLQRKMQISMQRIEEYCSETYPELRLTINSSNTPPAIYPADSLLPEDFRSETSMPPSLAWAIAERRYEDARRMLDSSLSMAQSFSLYCLRGHLYKAMDSLEASIADYSRALSLQESGEIYLRRGTQYFTANKREEAYQDFDHAMRLDPKDAQAVFMRGESAYNLKRFEEACDDWHLAAQMGHPLADSILAVKCASMLPKYARIVIAEKKMQMKTMLFLLDNIKENLRLRKGITPKESTFILDSLSYKSLGGMCDMKNILDNSLSTACMIHLLYKMTLEIHDNVASNFVQNLVQNAHSQARSNFDFSRVAQPSMDQTMRTIDYNKQIVDAVASPNPTRFEVEKVQSLQDLQRQQTQALERSSANNPYKAPSSQTLQSTAIIQQMRTYLLTKYAEFMEE